MSDVPVLLLIVHAIIFLAGAALGGTVAADLQLASLRPPAALPHILPPGYHQPDALDHHVRRHRKEGGDALGAALGGLLLLGVLAAVLGGGSKRHDDRR